MTKEEVINIVRFAREHDVSVDKHGVDMLSKEDVETVVRETGATARLDAIVDEEARRSYYTLEFAFTDNVSKRVVFFGKVLVSAKDNFTLSPKMLDESEEGGEDD